MSNCVYSLVDQISRGLTYVYRVLAPERGTLSLVNTYSQPQINEFSLCHNRQPGMESLMAVQTWLAHAVKDKDCEEKKPDDKDEHE